MPVLRVKVENLCIRRDRNCQKDSHCLSEASSLMPARLIAPFPNLVFSTLTFSDMYNPKCFLQLYADVLYYDIADHFVRDWDISARLANMAGVYAQGFGPVKVIDYNGISNRCAYLHKYAPTYTAVVYSTMRRILAEETTLKFRLESGAFRMCSLGGGPGTDVVGIVAALDAAIGDAYKWRTSVTVVDDMEGWRLTFKSVLRELRLSELFSHRFSDDRFSWKYVQGDLLDFRKHEIWDSVTYSSLVTIVKCLSTFRSSDVQRTITRIFRAMSFGSFILIIDDDVEELTELIMRTADSQQLVPIFGPVRHVDYSFEGLKATEFGHTSCHQATVTALLLTKPIFNPKSPFAPKPSPTTKHCLECGNTVFECFKCSVEKVVRNFFSRFRRFSSSNSALRGNESKTPTNSQSVVVELPDKKY